MPIAADLPPNWKVPAQEVRSNYALQGSVGKDLMNQFGLVVNHWQNRPGFGIDSQFNNESSINHVPFKKVGTIKVRFKQSQPMRPRTLQTEDHEEE